MSKKAPFTTIIFDAGFTLVNFEGDFQKAVTDSYLALANFLVDAGYNFPPDEFIQKYTEVMSEYYRSRNIDMIERPVEIYLQKVLDEFDQFRLPEKTLAQAIREMYRVTESLWQVEADSHPVLSQLKSDGYQLGMISNAANAGNINRSLDNHNLRKYFEVILISAEEGIRKPDVRIFKRALNLLNAKPENTVMVGDTLGADILGAKNSGIYTVWITRRADRFENREAQESIIPDAKIDTLAELPELLKSIK